MNSAWTAAPRRQPTFHVSAESWVRWIGIVAWLIILVGLVVEFIAVPQADSEFYQPILLVVVALFFSLQLARLIVSAFAWPSSRPALMALGLGLALWALGSTLLTADQHASTTEFPAPGELLFLASYIGFAAFLVLDTTHRSGRALIAWLDAAIVCGGAAAVAGAILMTPFARVFPEGGLPLLIALIFPLIDLMLAVVVLGQWALSARTFSRRTVQLIAGFVLMAVADSSLVLNLGGDTYTFSTALTVAWGLAIGLIVSAACVERTPIATMSRRLPIGFLVASFAAALVLLLARPTGLLGLALALPAAVTVLATGARLIMSLRESQALAEAFHLAQTDDLTGLPNRRAVLRKLDAGIQGEQPLGLMLLDLDGFKEVNDTLGHSAGDTLLELVALRMREALPAEIELARVGGDEFAIIVPSDDPLELMERGQEIRRTLLAPARVEGLELGMHASLGITVRQDGDARAADLLRRADIAMYEAKVQRSGVQLYDAQHDEFSRQRLQMGEELRRALQRGQVVAWYQPKVDASSMEVVGLEALVRWVHPERGTVSPMEFLPVARRAGLMQDLSEVVARHVVDDALRWRRNGLALDIALNVAPPELLGGILLPRLYKDIADARLPDRSITIEVTEDTFLTDPARAREVLRELQAHGLSVSIDDYGTGFSSLAYLRDLPVDELKMDRSFISTIGSDDRSRLIVMSTVDMAHALDLKVVAEGVEDAAISQLAVSLGVDILQGYNISKPMAAEAVEPWVRAWNRSAGAPSGPRSVSGF